MIDDLDFGRRQVKGRKKNPLRQQTVLQRGDHQSRDEPPRPSGRVFPAMSHEVKIYKYRDRLLAMLRGRIDRDLFDLLDQRSQLVLGSLAENSEIAGYSDLCAYVELMVANGIEPLPIRDRALEFYLDTLVGRGVKYSTINRHMASLGQWHKWLELPDPRRSFAIATKLRRIRRDLGRAAEQKQGLRMADLRRAVSLHRENVPRDVADLCLLFTAFETLCRRSELIAFTWDDLTVDERDGAGLLHLRSSKTDQDKEGKYLYISPVTVQLLRYWRIVSGQAKGRIFRAILSDGSIAPALSDRGVANAFKRIARKLGIPDTAIAGHSTRVGAAQEMVERNISETKIMLSGRWKSPAMLYRYTEKAAARESGMAELTGMEGWTPRQVLARDEEE